MKRVFGPVALGLALWAPALAQPLMPKSDEKAPLSAPVQPAIPLPDELGQVDGNADKKAQTRRVERFVVQGNTILKEEELRGLLKLYEGKELTLAQMREAAADLTSLYQRKGYYLVRAIVPVQDFKSPEVKLTVVEGKIGQIRVEGAEHYDPDFIKRRFQVSGEDGNFRADKFTRSLILMNELPDLDVKAVFAPGREVGTADVILKTRDRTPVHFGVDYNNYGTPETGVNRVGLDFDAGNLLFQADQLQLRGVVGFPSRNNNFFQVQYGTPINLQGTTLNASYANGAFAVSQGLGAILDVRGNADIFTLTLSHPMERDLDFTSNLGLAVSHKNITNNFFGGRFPFSHDEYTMTRLSYMADWRGPSGRSILQASWSQGFGGTPETDPLVSRAGANGRFSRFNLDGARIHRLSEGLYGVVRGSVQYATSPLYVGEQFALGGPDTVRGYQQAELLGDNAYLVGAELRWSPIPEALDAFQLAFFVDHGGVSLNRKLPGDLSRGSSLTGAGLGLRWSPFDQTNIRLDVGFPISPTESRSGNTPALYLGVQTRY